MSKRWKVFRGLAASFCAGIFLLTNVTQIMVANQGSISRFLGVEAAQSGMMTAENMKFKTDFSEDGTTSKESIKKLNKAEDAYVIQVSEEGSVLLQNDNAALPMKKDAKVTLFGRAFTNPVYRGISNGASFDLTRGISAKAAFESVFDVNETIITAYKEGDNAVLTQEQKATFSEYSDAAIVMLWRKDGEGSDCDTSTRELALNADEKAMLEEAKNGNFGKIVVLLNSGYPMEVEILKDYNVDACMWIGYPGVTGFQGVANLLTNANGANPSGKLVETYAADSFSSPAMQNFGDFTFANSEEKYLIYAEGIYVGYRYYETRYEDLMLGQGNAGTDKGVFASAGKTWNYADEVTYPFGYGLSYTTFTQEIIDEPYYDSETDTFTITVKVTNTGEYAGKSTVQVYAQTPYTDYDKQNLVEKSAIMLAGYGKTDVLEPGASADVTVSIDRYLLASYDANGVAGYILDAGDYYLALGDDAHDALNNVLAAKGISGLYDQDGNAVEGNAAKTWKYTLDVMDDQSYRTNKVTGEEVTNRFTNDPIFSSDYNYYKTGKEVTYLTRQDWNTFPETYNGLTSSERMVQVHNGDFLEELKGDSVPSKDDIKTGVTDGETIKFIDMYGVPLTGTYEDEQGNKVNAEEKWDKFLNQLSISDLATVTADDFGIQAVSSVSLPNIVNQDGPDGIRGNYRDSKNVGATLFNNVSLMASTFDTELMHLRGYYIGEDGIHTGVSQYWGPGCNNHRTPYGGREFEYMSEDSLVSYYALSEVVDGVQEKGVICAPKHLAANDQETNRSGVMTFMTEQTLREITLRSFESAYTVAKTTSTMTSYNAIGACYTARNKALMNDVVRGEWGYEGMFITDAGSCIDTPILTLASGTDMFCLGGTMKDTVVKAIEAESDGFGLQALREANKHFYSAYANSIAVNGLDENTTTSEFVPLWLKAVYGIDILVGVTAVVMVGLFIVSTYVKRKGEND